MTDSKPSKQSKAEIIAATLTALRHRLAALTAETPDKLKPGELSDIFSTTIKKPLTEEIVDVLSQLLSAAKTTRPLKAKLLQACVEQFLLTNNYSNFKVFISIFNKSTPFETLVLAAKFCARHRDLDSFKQVVMCMPARSKTLLPSQYSQKLTQFIVLCLMPVFLPGIRWLVEESRFRADLVEFEPSDVVEKAIVMSCISDARGVGRYLCTLVFGYGEEVLAEFVRRHDMFVFDIDVNNQVYVNGPRGEKFYDRCRVARLNLLTIFEREKKPLQDFPDIFLNYCQSTGTRVLLENLQPKTLTLENLDEAYIKDQVQKFERRFTIET